MRRFVFAAVCLMFFVQESRADIFLMLSDEFDKDAPRSTWNHKDVLAAQKELELFTARLDRLKERDIEALFGKPSREAGLKYSMPLAQHRGYSLSGFGDWTKKHSKSYAIGRVATLQVNYDGASPEYIVVYLAVDDSFEPVTEKNLARRLTWDRERLGIMFDRFERKRVEVFPWEVDRDELKKRRTNDFDEDPKARLESWLKTGEKLGWLLEKNESPFGANLTQTKYEWYIGKNRLFRQAFFFTETQTYRFHWLTPKGNFDLRRDIFRGDRLIERKWARESGQLIRVETIGAWHWYEKDDKHIRREWDDNNDGIPDFWSTDWEGKDRKPLKMDESWAIHHTLIPPDCRVPGEAEMSLPIRRTKLPDRLLDTKKR